MMFKRCLPALVFAAVLLAVGAPPVHAKPQFLDLFLKTYHPAAGTPLLLAKCQTCHSQSGPPDRNPYGRALKDLLDSEHAKLLTADILHKAENLDSDGDGWTNGEEIAAGTLPGDPQSHTARHPANTPAAPGPQTNSTPAAKPSQAPGLERMLMPKHSFHPIVVHFALALFTFGALLELYGARTRRPALREAGFLNMAAAGIAGIIAATTGLIAVYRNGFTLQGTLLIHLFLGITAAVGMAAAAFVGRRAAKSGRERSSRFYWALVILGLMAVLSAAFFGGEFVYTDLMGM